MTHKSLKFILTNLRSKSSTARKASAQHSPDREDSPLGMANF